MAMRIKVSTTDSVPNETTIEYKGLIFDRVVAGVGAFTEFFASLTDVWGGRSGKMESQMDSLYYHLIQSMEEKASRVGANAIVGLRVDIDEISGKGMSMLMISGTGTAVLTKTAGGIPTHAKDESQKNSMWTCVDCGKMISSAYEFCPDCGTKRSWPWKCGGCEAVHDALVKYCPKCGKRKDASEEIVPESANYEIDRMLDAAREMKNAADMLAFFRDALAGDANPDVAHFLSALEKKVEFERMYGSAKADAMKIVDSFLGSDMKYARVDRSTDEISCPICGTKQRSNRSMCLKCAVEFVDLDK